MHVFRTSQPSSEPEPEELGPSPRLCILRIWPDFQGYGFNLHAEKTIPGQFIGKVEPGSPAEEAGLRKGDHIIEVNNENVQDGTHTEVVSKIKTNADAATLLVINKEDEEYYRSRNITVHRDLPNVIVGEAAVRAHNHMNFDDEEEDNEVNNNAEEKGEANATAVTEDMHTCFQHVVARNLFLSEYGFKLSVHPGSALRQ